MCSGVRGDGDAFFQNKEDGKFICHTVRHSSFHLKINSGAWEQNFEEYIFQFDRDIVHIELYILQKIFILLSHFQ